MNEVNERSSIVYYSITLKPLSSSKVYYPDDFAPIVARHFKTLNIMDITYEQDSNHILHAHILAEGRGEETFKPIRWWHTDIQKTENIQRWASYMRKHARNADEQDNILWQHYSYHNNLFEE